MKLRSVIHLVSSLVLGALLAIPYSYFSHQGQFLSFFLISVAFTICYVFLSAVFSREGEQAILWDGVLATILLISLGQYLAYDRAEEFESFAEFTEQRVEEGFYDNTIRYSSTLRHSQGFWVWAAWAYQCIFLLGLVYIVARAFNEDSSESNSFWDEEERPEPRVILNTGSSNLQEELFAAIAQKNYSELKALLDGGINPNIVNSFGESPLVLAIRYGPLKSCKALLAAGARAEAVEDSGPSPLHTLVGSKFFFELLPELIKNGADVNELDYGGYPAIFGTARRADLKSLEALLKEGADIKGTHTGGDNLMHALLRYPIKHKQDDQKKRLEFAKVLIAEGVEYDLQGQYGDSALRLAASFSQEIVVLLLEQGVNLEFSNQSNTTALQTAAHAHPGIAKLLIEAGAELDLYSATCLEKLEEVRELSRSLSKDTLNNSSSTFPYSPLGVAAAMHNRELMEVLIAAGASGNCYSRLGPGLIALIRSKASTDLGELLINAGANVNCFDGDGNTALMHAVRAGSREWCKYLLDHGADPDLSNERGATPGGDFLNSVQATVS